MPGRSTALVLLATLVLAAPLAAASPASLSDRELVDRVLRIYDPAADADATESGTSLMKTLARRFDSLDKEDRARVVHLLDEPVTTGPGAPEGQRRADTEHFEIFFQESGTDAVPAGDRNGNNLPDYVDEVGTYLEKAWSVEVDELGFAPPPKGNDRLRVHLKNINHNGLTHASTGKKAWIELNSDIAAYTRRLMGSTADSVVQDPSGLQAGMLKACAAHEFFHCIQAAYDWEESNWWCEGTAEWMGNRVFPESKFYANNVKPRFTAPHVSLFAPKGWFEYASSVFAVFVAENYGGDDAIKRTWEGCKGDATVQDALADTLGDLHQGYEYFACYAWLRAFPDGSLFPAMKSQRLQAPGSFSPAVDKPEHFGANYVEIPSSGTGTLDLSVTLKGKGAVRLVTVLDGKWKILPHAADASGRLAVQIPLEGVDTVLVAVVGFQEDGELDYTVQAR